MELSPLAAEILVRRLGQSDAFWWPLRIRDWQNPGAIRLAQMRGDVIEPLHRVVASDAERQRHSRASAELAHAGLIRRGKLGNAKITEAGARVARGLAWPSTYAELRDALDRLAERTKAGDCIHQSAGYGDNLVPETFIAGTPWGPDCDHVALGMLATTMLPALRTGLVQSASSTKGHVFYRLASGPVSDSQLADVVDAALGDTFDETLADMYREQSEFSRQQILSADAGGELGFIPLHVGLLKSHRDYSDLSGIEPLWPKLSEASNVAGPSSGAVASTVANSN